MENFIVDRSGAAGYTFNRDKNLLYCERGQHGKETDDVSNGSHGADGGCDVCAGPPERAHRGHPHFADQSGHLLQRMAAGAEVRHVERGGLSGAGRCGSAGVLRLRRGPCQAGGPHGRLSGGLPADGVFIEKSNGSPVVSGIGLVLGDAACYVLGTAWFVFQMQCDLGYALAVCVYPFIALDLGKIVVSCIVGALMRKRLIQAGVLKLA